MAARSQRIVVRESGVALAAVVALSMSARDHRASPAVPNGHRADASSVDARRDWTVGVRAIAFTPVGNVRHIY